MSTARPVKQIIVMRKDLNMRKGKMIAQGAHASISALLGEGFLRGREPWIMTAATPEMADWLRGGYTKICVSANSEAELLEIHRKAEEAGLRTGLITDSGKTEFAGVPTLTCLAIGPNYSDEVDAITGNLPLL